MSDHDLLLRIDGRVERLERLLLGNGQPGTCSRQDKRISVIEDWIASAKGALKIMAWAAGVVVTVGGLVLAAVKG